MFDSSFVIVCSIPKSLFTLSTLSFLFCPTYVPFLAIFLHHLYAHDKLFSRDFSPSMLYVQGKVRMSHFSLWEYTFMYSMYSGLWSISCWRHSNFFQRWELSMVCRRIFGTSAPLQSVLLKFHYMLSLITSPEEMFWYFAHASHLGSAFQNFRYVSFVCLTYCWSLSFLLAKPVWFWQALLKKVFLSHFLFKSLYTCGMGWTQSDNRGLVQPFRLAHTHAADNALCSSINSPAGHSPSISSYAWIADSGARLHLQI